MLLTEMKFNYSCIFTLVPQPIVNKLHAWSTQFIPDSVLVVNDEAKGRENEYHITVKYGLIDAKPTEPLMNLLKNFRPFSVKIDNISLFKNGNTKGFDVVKCGIISPDLHKLNNLICGITKYVDTYKNYIPHLTLAYVKPDSCNHLINKNPLGLNNQFTVTNVVFSGKGDDNDNNINRIKETIKLFDVNYKKHF